MINFFRNIRKQLANENKFQKYFRYAFGEILLVVIGILIALQVNNWNEKRIHENEFKNVLEQIYNSVDRDLSWYDWTIYYSKEQIEILSNFLKDPDTIQSDKLISVLVYLDTYPLSINSESAYFLSKLSPDPNNGLHNQLAQEIFQYTTFIKLEFKYQLPPSIQEFLYANGFAIEMPLFGENAYNNFSNVNDSIFYTELERQKIKSIIGSNELKVLLRTLISKKKQQVNHLSYNMENGVALKQQIEAYYPGVKLLYSDIGIIGSAISGWDKSTPMHQVDKKLNIWEIKLELKSGVVKFRSRDSWMRNWGGDTFPNGTTIFYGDEIFVEPGIYRVVLNLNEKTYQFIKQDDQP